MSQVERLQALLGRVQKNRLLARASFESEETDESLLALGEVERAEAPLEGLGGLTPELIPALRAPAVPDDAPLVESPESPAESLAEELVEDAGYEDAGALAESEPPPAESPDEPVVELASEPVVESPDEPVVELASEPVVESPDEPVAIEVHVSVPPPAIEEPEPLASVPVELESLEPVAAAAQEAEPTSQEAEPTSQEAEPISHEASPAVIEIEIEHEIFEAPQRPAPASVVRLVAAPREGARPSFAKLLARSLAARPKSR